MQSLALVSRINVLTAIRDHDLQGSGPFLEALGFPIGNEVLIERGKRYDARALLSYAHGKATGEYLTPEQVTFGSLQVLTDLEFTVASRSELDRPKPTAARNRAASPRASRAVAAPRTPKRPEPVVELCPTCFTQLSVTGVCNYCE